MQLGQTINNIRKEKGMTQEEFAKKFHVTRQTVSNWENEKCYPDLLTLVNISDDFNISLDIMLKENKQMTSKLNKEIKIGRKVKYTLLCLIGILILSSFTWFFIWNNAKNETEIKFQQGVQQNEFVFNEQLGYYIKTINNSTYYSIPNQKMPTYFDFTTDFHAKHLDCFTSDNNKKIQIRWVEKDTHTSVIGIYYLDENGTIESTLSMDQIELLQNDNSDVKNLIIKGNEIYSDIYMD